MTEGDVIPVAICGFGSYVAKVVSIKKSGAVAIVEWISGPLDGDRAIINIESYE